MCVLLPNTRKDTCPIVSISMCWMSRLKRLADSTLQKDKPVAVYCRSGKRSKKAAAILSKKGYIIYDLDKGFIGWEEAGKEVEK